MNYRREIDGLRALAVIPVILFHAGFQAFSGGFVGVDVFFVISGYLITSLILAEMQVGKFSLVNFYERRARRILPALFFVMFACLPFAWLWLLPSDIRSFSHSLVAVTGFVSNIFFYFQSSYFDTAAELKPLLHTWSLAVEEQYYLLFPVFLLITWRLGKRWIVGILAVIMAMSLAAANWGSINAPSLTFFLLPTRGWELLIGAFGALGFFKLNDNKLNKATNQVLSFLGLLLIVYSIYSFSKQTPFPSLYALIPTVGALLIILFATEETVVGKILSTSLFVGIGLISYSAYLWHQPIFAFVRYHSIEEPSNALIGCLIGLTLIVSIFTWKFIETPFRNKRILSRKTTFTFAVIGTVFFISINAIFSFFNYFEDRLTPNEKKITSYVSYDIKKFGKNGGCFINSSNDPPTAFSSECGSKSVNGPSLLIWGDSHAASLSVGMRSVYQNVIQYTSNSCPPIVGMSFAGARYCKDINDFVIRQIAQNKPTEVVLDAYWYSYGDRSANVEDTISYIRKVSPLTKITLVGNLPLWRGTLPMNLIRNHLAMDKELRLQIPLYDALHRLDEDLKLIADRNNIRFFSAVKAMCVIDKCLAVVVTDHIPALTTFDYGHLTAEGSVFLAGRMLSY